jgi:hypothetical protein
VHFTHSQKEIVMSEQGKCAAYDLHVLDSIFVDEISAILPVGAVTHLVFAARRPEMPSGKMESVVQARLIVPADRVQSIGRALLAGALPTAHDEAGDAIKLN